METKYQLFLKEEKRLDDLHNSLVANRNTFCTVQRMSLLMHGQPLEEKRLICATKELGLPTFEFFDVNKEAKVAYHRDAWREAYRLTF